MDVERSQLHETAGAAERIEEPGVDHQTQQYAPREALDHESLYRGFQSYPFLDDPGFLSGLAAILGHPETSVTRDELQDKQDLVMQAQCFYFSRMFNVPPIDPDEYLSWLRTNPTEPGIDASDDPTIINTVVASDTATTTDSEKLDPVVLSPSKSTEKSQETDSSRTNNPSTSLNDGTSVPSDVTIDQQAAVQTNSPDVKLDDKDLYASIDAKQSPSTAPSISEPPPYPTSFAEIVDLITRNIPIPGIEQIPDTVLELGSSKVDNKARRRKPWEKAGDKDVDDASKHESSTAQDGAGKGVESLEAGNVDTELTEAKPRYQQAGNVKAPGVMNILLSNAVPDSGLLARD